MTPVRWRHAAPGDERALAQLGAATFLATFAHDHPGGPLIEHLERAHSADFYAAALADPERLAIVGETPLGAPIGYALLTPCDLPVEPRAGDWEIKRFYLLGPWQGGGNGDTLMAECFAAARARGVGRLILAVYPQNARARRFYERHGFAQIGTTTFMVGDVPFEDDIFAVEL